MSTEFKLQDPGEGIHEAEIREVLVSPGDEVEEGDHVLVIETDKAAIEIPSPYTGKIADIAVSADDMVRVGDVLMTFEDAGDDASATEESGEEPEKPEPKAKKKGRESKAKADEPEPSERKPRQERRATEKARPKGPVPATPATRRLAAELGVRLEDVNGGGKDGRVTEEDVRAHAGEAEAKPRARREEPEREAPAPLPDFSQWGPVERRPLRSVRRTIARRMATAWSRIPHVTHHDLVDITELESLRRRHQDELEREHPGSKLTLTVFLMKAAVAALREHPRFNASYDAAAGEIVLKRYYHVGLATDTGRGLMVPVIRDVDRKSVVELARELPALAERVRAGEAAPSDLRGGSFTITNVGPLGGASFTPIINHPEVAILGAGRARLEPAIDGDLDHWRVVPKLMLPLSLGFDHRVNDGADAARFMATLIEALTDPDQLALRA